MGYKIWVLRSTSELVNNLNHFSAACFYQKEWIEKNSHKLTLKDIQKERRSLEWYNTMAEEIKKELSSRAVIINSDGSKREQQIHIMLEDMWEKIHQLREEHGKDGVHYGTLNNLYKACAETTLEFREIVNNKHSRNDILRHQKIFNAYMRFQSDTKTHIRRSMYASTFDVRFQTQLALENIKVTEYSSKESSKNNSRRR